jgi:serine protease
MHGLRTFVAAALAAPLMLLAAPQARVIVAFKPEAAVLRGDARALSSEPASQRSQRLQRRADALVAQAGRPLTTGRAVAERWQVVRAEGLDSAALATRLAAHPDVAWAVPDRRRRALALPNDPLYPAVTRGRPQGPDAGQWYLRAPDATVRSSANVEAAWDRATGSGVVIAVIDTGVRPDHPDLLGRLLPGIDTIDELATANDGDGPDGDASDPGDWVTSAEARSGALAGCAAGNSSWHGTQVATIAGASTNDNQGMAGTAHGARILPVRVLGKCGGYDSDIIAGMLWAAGLEPVAGIVNAHPARVLNMSLGGSGICEASYLEAVQRINAAGAVVVAAAGNDAGKSVGTPANCPGVIGVGGLRHAGTKVGFSDLGPEIALSAPGGNCVFDNDLQPCTYPILAGSNNGTQQPAQSVWTDSTDYGVGTSFASPIAAGAAALVLSARADMTPDDVRKTLTCTTRTFPSSGADNLPLDTAPVEQCRPADDQEQYQCYCTTALCGAGMLDVAGAVRGAQEGFACIAASTEEAVAGRRLVLDGLGGLPAQGRRFVSYQWSIIDDGGLVDGFDGSAVGSTATLVPQTAGRIVIALAATDDQGTTKVVQREIQVYEAPPSGGGASHPAWLLGLLGAAVALRRFRDRG